MDRPGFLPPSWVKEIVLLGDGDSDPEWTRAMIATCARRFEALGYPVSVAFASQGKDFNDEWMEAA